MTSNEIKQAVRVEQFRSRASYFCGAGLSNRLPKDYQEDPGLLAADLAFVVMGALCAAEEAGVELDLDAAVAAGQDLFEDLMRQARGEG